jgi:triosephosphate isomerase
VSRRKLIAGNWKLFLGPAEAAQVAARLRELLLDATAADVLLFPTALSLTSVVDALRGSPITVGVQAIHDVAEGAFTGSNSAKHARAAGAEYALIGHSERRHVFGEGDAYLARQLAAAFNNGLVPVFCVGEQLAERDAGAAWSTVEAQLQGLVTLPDDQAVSAVIAYEPVWAIGTGRTASPEQAEEMHTQIRGWLVGRYGEAGRSVRILYGGSVKADNAATLLARQDIDGLLVGGASLDPASFEKIVRAG